MYRRKTRPPSPPESYISKQYIFDEQLFDFGPLLINKDPEKRHTEASKKSNSSILRITNNGKYDVDIDFTLKSTLNDTPPDPKASSPSKSPFIWEPTSMHLPIAETQNLTLWAYPDEPMLYKDDLICLVKDNPNPPIFKIACLGARPIAELDSDFIQFDRLLVNQNASKTFLIKNVCPIPVKWRLEGIDKLPKEFEVMSNAGILKPCEQHPVEIKFNAIEENKFEQSLTLFVENNEGTDVHQEPKKIQLKAEAFNIDVSFQYDSPQNVLDFEAVRVGEVKEKQFSIKNVGLYEVKFNFEMKSRVTRENFVISPKDGILAPSMEIPISVRFKSKREIKEVKVPNTVFDIRLDIIEGMSGHIFKQVPVHVLVNSVYSDYSITPLKNINFGPMQFDEKKTRTFEIKNQGLFEFNYIIYNFKDAEMKEKIEEQREKELEEMGKFEEVEAVAGGKGVKGGKAAPKKEEKKAAPKGKAKGKGGKDALPDDALQIGQYTIIPGEDTITPGNSSIIEVTFTAKDAEFYQTTLGIDIYGKNPKEQSEGIIYELAAESCIPGINTTDVESIFEEQTVISSLDPSINTQSIITKSIYSIEENVFWFGTLIASKSPEGEVEKFKVINVNKIPCTVNFNCTPRASSRSEGFAFDVQPKQVKIPPHEHAYVKVYFKPDKMMSYGGIFEALVENSDAKSKGRKLSFELRGEGTLPSLVLEQPTELTEDGTPLLKFRKTRLFLIPIMY